MSKPSPSVDAFEPGQILENLWTRLYAFCTAATEDEADARWNALGGRCVDDLYLRLEDLRPRYLTDAAEARVVDAGEAARVYTQVQDAFRELRNRVVPHLRSPHFPIHRRQVAARHFIDLPEPDGAGGGDDPPSDAVMEELRHACFEWNRPHLDAANDIYFLARNQFDRLVLDVVSAPGPATDEENFVPVSELWQQRPEFKYLSDVTKFLDNTPNVPAPVGIRNRRPGERRREVHIGDWHRWFRAKDQQTAEALDEEALQEQIADIESRKASERARKRTK
jgi:hypothetical protein